MKNKILSIILTFAIVIGFSTISFSQKDPYSKKTNKEPLILISGIESGSYNNFAKEMKEIAKANIKIQTSKGSIDNYNILINNKDADMVFLQYDVLLSARMHDYKAREHNTDDVRMLLPLATEEIHLITKTESKINSIRDLAGKKVGIGIPSQQGTSVTAALIKSVTATDWEDIEISFDDAFDALLKGDIDAFFFVGYAPVEKLKNLPSDYYKSIRLVPILDNRLSQFHVKATIPADAYPWLHYNVETYAVRSILAVNRAFESREDAEKYTEFIKSIQQALPELKAKGNSKWNEVDFAPNGIQWRFHPSTKKVLGK